MNRIYCLIAILAITLAGNSCLATHELSNGGWEPSGPTIQSVTVTADNWNADETATVTVTFSGTRPFTIAIDVGTGENVPAGTTVDSSPYTWNFALEEGATFNYSVTVTDVYGTNTVTGTYGPVAETTNAAPEITAVNYEDSGDGTGELTVTVSDAEGDDVTVNVSDVESLHTVQNTVVVSGGNGDAEFIWTVSDVFISYGAGTTTITAWDDRHTGSPATTTADLEVEYESDWLTEGQLAAIPMHSTAAVGETVTVLVHASPFPTAQAFATLNGVAVTFEDGGDYVDGTFNIGSIGGGMTEVDGIWATMNPAPETFFMPATLMITAQDVTADSSLDYLAFNVTPVNAGEVTNDGDLFNFGISFDHAGEYHLGFLEFQDVKRTYYSDHEGVEYNFADIDNQFSQYSTTITVTE